MTELHGKTIGTVIGNTSPQEYSFILKGYSSGLGDIVCLEMEIPGTSDGDREEILVWGRIVELKRFNPFLPSEAGLELAEEGVNILQTVLSNSRDQVEGRVLVLGRTPKHDYRNLKPLNYPIQPGITIFKPTSQAISSLLLGKDDQPRLKIGNLIGRSDVEVSIDANKTVARHMAILAMTGGGKTVAARRVLRELIEMGYPVLILDPHGDYLGFWEKRENFKGASIELFYPDIQVNEENRDVVGYLVSQMTQGFTDPQMEVYNNAMEEIVLRENEEIKIVSFIERIILKLPSKSTATSNVVKRNLNLVKSKMEAMNQTNKRLRDRLSSYPFKPLPDPKTAAPRLISSNQASIVYLGGYDHMTQSTLVSIILQSLFENRASMSNQIPPFFCVIEEAHNFVPSRSEKSSDTPSIHVVRKVMTEGRKFGVGLLLVSQRPSRLDETALSQCNTFLIFRLVNPKDQTFVRSVMENLTESDARLIPGFGPGQGIVSGQSVRFPLVIQVKEDIDLRTAEIGDENFIKVAAEWKVSSAGQASLQSRNMEQELDSV